MVTGRALHFVFKVADRTLTAKFYREILGMKVNKISLAYVFLDYQFVMVGLTRLYLPHVNLSPARLE